MRKLTRNVLATAAAAATAVALTTVPASAAQNTWSVSPGGNITGQNVNGPVSAIDLTTGSPIICTVSTATGHAAPGTGLDGQGIAQLDSVTFATPGNPNNWCTGPVGIVVEVTAVGLPWHFNAQSHDAATGVTTGTLTGVQATLHGSDECDATVGGTNGAPTGTLTGTYNNSTGILQVTGNDLEVHSIDNDCDPTLIGQGDQAQLQGQYQLNPIQLITSP